MKLQASRASGIKLCKAQNRAVAAEERTELNKLVRFPYHICGEMTTVKVKIVLVDFSI